MGSEILVVSSLFMLTITFFSSSSLRFNNSAYRSRSNVPAERVKELLTFVKVKFQRRDHQLNSRNKWIYKLQRVQWLQSWATFCQQHLRYPSQPHAREVSETTEESCKNDVCPDTIIWHTLENTFDSKENKHFKFYHPRGRCLSLRHLCIMPLPRII